jgi:hypothetical protein
VLLEGLRDYAYHQIVEPDTFFQSQWEFLAEPLVAPRKTEKLSKDGNGTIAQAVTDFFRK